MENEAYVFRMAWDIPRRLDRREIFVEDGTVLHIVKAPGHHVSLFAFLWHNLSNSTMLSPITRDSTTSV